MANRNNNQNLLLLNSEVSPGNYVPEIAPKVYVLSNVSDANDVTYTIDQILGGMIVRDSAGAERTDTTPTAAQLIAVLGSTNIGRSFQFNVKNVGSQNVNVVGGVGVSLSGAVKPGETIKFELFINSTTTMDGISASSTSAPVELFNDDLTNFTVGSGGNYYYFAAGPISGDDAVVTYNSGDGCLDVSSVPFSKIWTPSIPDATGGLDHVKYLVYRNGAFTLPGEGKEFVYESEVAAQQTLGTIPVSIQPGITNPKSDIRIAGAALNMIDYVTWMVYDIFLSDEDIYAFYERLPFGRSDFGGTGPLYQAFSHAIPIAKRTRNDPSNDFTKLSININRSEGYVRWMVDGQEKFRINRLGQPISRNYRVLDHGGTSEIVDQQYVNCGFGTFTLLDMGNPAKDVSLVINPVVNPLVQLGLTSQYVDPISVNSVTGADIPTSFYSTTAADRLFGNGILLRLKYIKAYEQVV